LGLVLVALSAVLYFFHYSVFHDSHHIFIYLVGDIAFVPIEVLMVTLIIHRLLSAREKRSLLQKMNMVIGAFFSDAGTELSRILASADPTVDTVREKLVVDGKWDDKHFRRVKKDLKNYGFNVEPSPGQLVELKEFTSGKGQFMLNLLANPILLEHDSFTDLLWAASHMSEELLGRKDLNSLGEKDLEHIRRDLKRAYGTLVMEWLDYMQHLKGNYPYLFSLAMRQNPFDAQASVEVTG